MYLVLKKVFLVPHFELDLSLPALTTVRLDFCEFA